MAIQLVIKNAKRSAQGEKTARLEPGQHYQVAPGDSVRIVDPTPVKVISRRGRIAVIRTADGQEYLLDDFYPADTTTSAVNSDATQTLSWDDPTGKSNMIASADTTSPTADGTAIADLSKVSPNETGAVAPMATADAGMESTSPHSGEYCLRGNNRWCEHRCCWRNGFCFGCQ